MKENLFNNEAQKMNPLRSEHLKEGVSPIIGGIYDKSGLDPEIKKMIEDYKKNADGVSSFSECNDHNKWSEEPFLYCTGMIVSGIEKNTGKNISIMIHQNPGKLDHLFMKEEEIIERKKKFLKKVSDDLEKIKEKCEPKTIDCIVFGGNEGNDLYKKSIGTLNDACFKELGFEPVILTGPNMGYGGKISNSQTRLSETDVYFDNKNRRLHVVRSPQSSGANESYLPSDFEEQSKKWDESN